MLFYVLKGVLIVLAIIVVGRVMSYYIAKDVIKQIFKGKPK